MIYEGTVYRPPSEANSLIIQLTIGCARNTCTFCVMYKDKKFRVRDLNEVVEDLMVARSYYRGVNVKRIFLADGDALIVKTKDLLFILSKIKELFPECERVTAYGAPKDILVKTLEELRQLKNAGLHMIYMGLESGDDVVLNQVKKGVTRKEMVEAGQKLRASGMKLSMTIISGLGGAERLREHAICSAQAMNAIKPEYVGFLTLMAHPGTPLYDDVQTKKFVMLSPMEVFEEQKLFLQHTDSQGTIFRSNHISNYVNLSGTFNRDVGRLLSQLEAVQERKIFKPERFRGL